MGQSLATIDRAMTTAPRGLGRQRLRRQGGMNSTKKQARVAGLLYLLIGITAPIGLVYVPGALIVAGDATATANHIRASESLLRIGIASELFHQIVCIFLVLALYRLFKAVSEKHAALVLVRGADFLSVFETRQLDALALLFLRLHGQGLVVASIFWGLWLFPFGILVIRSGFIPRVLGVLMMMAGIGYLASSFTSLLLPRYAHPVGQFAMVLEIGELPIIFWFLIWGAKAQPSDAAAS